MKKMLALVILASAVLQGCASNVERTEVTPIAAHKCQKVEGAAPKRANNGQLAHKYVCSDVEVYAIKLWN